MKEEQGGRHNSLERMIDLLERIYLLERRIYLLERRISTRHQAQPPGPHNEKGILLSRMWRVGVERRTFSTVMRPYLSKDLLDS